VKKGVEYIGNKYSGQGKEDMATFEVSFKKLFKM
jgi:hypothetical protein